jgi:serine/threonine-protein kinase HipA
LPRLLSAAERVVSESESDEDLRLLLAPGSSLGGARPKASVRDRDGHLAVAKFPHREDEIDAVRWEAIEVATYFELDAKAARTIAADVGQAVATWRAEAARLGLSPSEIDRMASAFEHEDLPPAS